MRILVAGAGYVGSELARQLVVAGHEVWVGRRSDAPVPEGAHRWTFDLTDPGLEVPAGITHLAYTAAPDHGDAESYVRTYVDGLRNVLAACDRGGVSLERALFTSSTAVYAVDDGRVDEDTPTTAEGNAAHLLAAEALVRARPGGIALRLAGIYGPGRNRLVRMVREGTARCTRSRPIGNRIHRDDCAGAAAHLLALPDPASVYVGVDHAPVELCEVYQWLAAELGLPPIPETDELDARAQESRRGGARKRCSNARLVASGYRFRFPTYREGYAPLLET
jgi:nucleoside-diphosphate-sugar epimerase